MILVRHGQSAFNAAYGATGRDPGIHDPELTDEGRQQAEVAARYLKTRAPRHIVTSPYTRALQTADILSRALDLPVSVEPLVRERAAFACDIGTPASRLASAWPALEFAHVEERWWAELEEEEAAVVRRCDAFRRVMAARTDWSRTVVVSHWGFIRTLAGRPLPNGAWADFDPTAA